MNDIGSNSALGTDAITGSGVATAFGCPRDPLGNRFVYAVVSPRAHGLSIGVNLNPDRRCDFDCVYCEVDRRILPPPSTTEVQVLADELERTLDLVNAGRLRERPLFRNLPDNLLQLQHVAISGDGEPTLSAVFREAVEKVLHLRALGRVPPFKLVLVTNAANLDRREVLQPLELFHAHDEVWAKLEAGTEEYFRRVNRASVSLETIQANILRVARRQTVVIQSLFPSVGREGLPVGEILALAQRVKALKDAGGRITAVQICSATHLPLMDTSRHLPLNVLFRIAKQVGEISGVPTEVF